LLSLSRLTVRFGLDIALDDVTLAFGPGELVGLVGGAGAGKSVLLKTACGLVAPAAGTVSLLGIDLAQAPRERLAWVRRDVGFCFQNLALFESLDAAANVAYGLVRQGVEEGEARRRAIARLKAVGLEAAVDKRPGQLSGGMRRRLALARAMVAGPKVGLYDDPFTGLDPVACARIAALIRRAHDEVGGLTIVAASDPAPLLAVCDRFVLLDAGGCAFDGPVEAFARADAAVVRRYLGREAA
jgi:ABC-type transporter Mla maintaining outer membrane lipid asymmetry ATPase subunit MlaF